MARRPGVVTACTLGFPQINGMWELAVSRTGADDHGRHRPKSGIREDQQLAVDRIVRAVADGEYGRVSILIERFVVDAELETLFALREAFADEAARRRRANDVT